MFQNAFHVVSFKMSVTHNNYGVYIYKCVLFEQVIIQEIVTYLILSCL